MIRRKSVLHRKHRQYGKAAVDKTEDKKYVGLKEKPLAANRQQPAYHKPVFKKLGESYF